MATQSHTPLGTALEAIADGIRATIDRREDREIILDHPDGPGQSQEPFKAEGKAGEEERGAEGREEGRGVCERVSPTTPPLWLKEPQAGELRRGLEKPTASKKAGTSVLQPTEVKSARNPHEQEADSPPELQEPAQACRYLILPCWDPG